jgi:hypothetical protein
MDANTGHKAGSIGQVALSELVGALSFALDLTEGQPPGHSLRCCWIGMHIGRALGLPPEQLSDLYYTLLLKDVGCSSNAARICELFMTDDLSFKRNAKTVDDSLPEQVRFALSQAGAGSGLAEKLRAVVKLARAGRRSVMHELVDTRCHRGAEVVRQLQFSEDVARAILDLDEHWNGKGLPEGLGGEAISLYARIALLSQVTDVFQVQTGPEAAMAEVQRRSGIWFDPALVATLAKVGEDPNFWRMLSSIELDRAVVALEPENLMRRVDEDYLDAVAVGFAQVIDAKSPFTRGHSDRVAVLPTSSPRRWASTPPAGAGCGAPRCCTTSASSGCPTRCSTSRRGSMPPNGPASGSIRRWGN